MKGISWSGFFQLYTAVAILCTQTNSCPFIFSLLNFRFPYEAHISQKHTIFSLSCLQRRSTRRIITPYDISSTPLLSISKAQRRKNSSTFFFKKIISRLNSLLNFMSMSVCFCPLSLPISTMRDVVGREMDGQ